MAGEHLIYRHTLVVRVTHWIDAVCLTVLLMSGLQIFNAHPALYFGKQSHFDSPALAITAAQHDGRVVGITQIGGHSFTTTGVLGASKMGDRLVARAFPSWATLPSVQDLATGRRWHFFFAWLFVLNGLVYLTYSLLSGHAWRDLVPPRSGLRKIGGSLLDHLRLRFPRGEEARHYNVLQRLSYLVVAFVLLPVAVLAGLTMSPALNSLFPPLLDLFGGRQSARTIHFIAAAAIVLFVIVHVVMVVLSGVVNNMRSMITGRYDIGKEG